jgi:hypothetical protein
MSPEHMIGTLHQQTTEVDVARLGEAELRVSLGPMPYPNGRRCTPVSSTMAVLAMRPRLMEAEGLL